MGELRRLKNRAYEAIVITAGQFHHLLLSSPPLIDINQFCVLVFDECHHCVGAHVYAGILEQLALVSPNNRPRIIGMSASPFQADTEALALTKFIEMRHKFFNPLFYKPDLVIEDKTSWVVVRNQSSIPSF